MSKEMLDSISGLEWIPMGEHFSEDNAYGGKFDWSATTSSKGYLIEISSEKEFPSIEDAKADFDRFITTTKGRVSE